jgi:FecR protein
MSKRRILCWALTPLLGLPAFAQSVISAHSGLVQYSDGTVFLDDQRVEQKTGKFEQMNNGSELRTDTDGRAEVLLTPATFLRVGSNSAIRMLSNKLDDTRVELLRGSAVLDQGTDALADTSVTIVYNLDQVQIKKPGRYRFDSEPPQVKVESGEAQVTGNGKNVDANAGYAVPFDDKLVARKLLNDPAATPGAGDDLDRWDQARSNAVDQGNLDAAATSDLSNVIDGWNKDPDSVLQSLGIPPYIPGMSSAIPPPGYGAYGSGLDPYGYGYGYGYGAGLYPYGSGLYFSALYPYGGLYGPGLVSPFLLYGAPLYRPLRNYPSYTYRGPGTIYGSRTGFGSRSGFGYGYGGYGARPSVGFGVGRAGGIGMGHVGGRR